jgi:hypothetical protein
MTDEEKRLNDETQDKAQAERAAKTRADYAREALARLEGQAVRSSLGDARTQA